MPACLNCEAFVTQDFERVFAPDERGVETCPNCVATAGSGERKQDIERHRGEAAADGLYANGGGSA